MKTTILELLVEQLFKKGFNSIFEVRLKLKLEILNKTENECELRVFEEGHSLMSVLRKELFNDPLVIHAGYMIKHPLIKEVRLYVKTIKDKKPIDALVDALKRLEGKIDDFEVKFEEALAES